MIQIDEYDTPWEIACKMINATRTRRVKGIKGGKWGEYDEEVPMLEIQDLKRIGEHLLHYANTEAEEDDGE